MPIQDDIHLTGDFANPGIHAFVLLGRTVFELLEEPARFVRAHGITPTQLNVLRILRGTPGGLPHREIRARMLANVSDVSRLLDKLARDGFAERVPSDDDRRVVLGRITRKGRALVARLEEPLNEMHTAQFERIGAAKTRQLIELLEELRAANRKE